MMRRVVSWVALLVLLSGGLLSGRQVAAQPAETYVDVELVIAVDVSLSMDQEEQFLQREGYVKAFVDPKVLNAIRSGLHGKIAVAFVEWAGSHTQNVLVDWTLLDGEDSAAAFSAQLAGLPLSRLRRTSISGAIDFAAGMFENNGYRGMKRVIDVSGDGPNNQGDIVTAARDRTVAQGIVINGLPFMSHAPGIYSMFSIPDLDLYYADCVVGGPGAFTLPVHEAEEFASAIRSKLVLEIAGPVPPRPGAAAEPRVPCDTGERIWRMYMNGEP